VSSLSAQAAGNDVTSRQLSSTLGKRIIAVAALAIWTGSSMAATPGNQPFMVFDGLLYQGKPDSAALGMKPIKQVNSPPSANPIPHRVDDEAVRATLRGLLSYRGLIFLDYEYWPLNPASPAQLSSNIDMLNRVLSLAREVLPDATIGYYALLPCPDYWSVVSGDPGKFNAWQSCNAALDRIAEHVDVILPSLYTFYNDQQGWDKFAAAQLEAARRYHKPVYAFLWPEFHISNTLLRGTNIPAGFWRHELDFCKAHADGIVIWGGWQERWDEQAAWWLVTKAFLDNLNSQ
jgi:hypothetical protein